MSYPSIRINPSEIESIVSLFKMFFDGKDHLWIFGSRVDLKKKGGDIDLYIETHISDVQEVNKAKIDFLAKLYHAIGDQKIDVIINRVSHPFSMPIYDLAKQEGVQLV